MVNKNELLFRLDEKQTKTKRYNQSWIGYLIAFITLLFLVYQSFETLNLENDIENIKNQVDSLNFNMISLKDKYDDLKNLISKKDSLFLDLNSNLDKQK